MFAGVILLWSSTDFDLPVDVSNCNFSISFQMPEMLFLVFREVHEVFEQKCIYSGKYYNREENTLLNERLTYTHCLH